MKDPPYARLGIFLWYLLLGSVVKSAKEPLSTHSSSPPEVITTLRCLHDEISSDASWPSGEVDGRESRNANQVSS
jgi:hypothetical protein